MSGLVERAPTQRAAGPYRLLAAVSLGGLLAPLNSTMLAVALPEIRSSFDVSVAAIGWLVSSYLITMAVMQPVGGRLGDQLGRGRVFRAGLVAFLVLSLLAAVAPTFEALVLLRTGQAAVGAMMMPNGMALLRTSVPVYRLGRLNGLNGAVMSTSAATGPLLGALLLGLGSWRWLFLMNVPFALLSFALMLSMRDADSTPAAARARLDWRGTAIFAALLVAVTWLLNGSGGGHGARAMVIGAGITLALVAGFIFSQRGVAVPAVEWVLFKSRAFAAATSYTLLSNLVMYTTLLTVPFFIEAVQQRSPTTTGLLLGVMSGMMALMAAVGGTLADAAGRRTPALIGAGAATAGAVALLIGLDASTPFVYMAIALGVTGFGVGIGGGPAMTAAIESVPVALAGSAAGANSMMRYVGSIIGVGVLGGVLDTRSGEVPGLAVFRLLLGFVAVMAVATIAAAALMHRFPPGAREATAPPAPGEPGAAQAAG